MVDFIRYSLSDGYFHAHTPGVVLRKRNVCRDDKLGYRFCLFVRIANDVAGEHFGVALACNNHVLAIYLSPVRTVTCARHFETYSAYRSWITEHVHHFTPPRFELSIMAFTGGPNGQYRERRFELPNLAETMTLQPRMGDQSRCAVCLDTMNGRSHRTCTTLNCGHSFHRDCAPRPDDPLLRDTIDQTLMIYIAQCPLCRYPDHMCIKL